MKKKMMALVLCVALVAVAAVGATMAYFTDTKTAENTFTVGNVEITLDEAKVDLNGEYVKNADGTLADRVTKNAYKLIPGHTYVKDPTITVVKGSEECYVRAIVTINKAAALDTIFAPDGVDLRTILTGTDTTKWEYKGVTKDAANDARIYTLWYKGTVNAADAAQKLAPVFTELVVPGDLTSDQLKTLEGLKITVEANAIQADNLDTPEEAWDVFHK